VADAGEAPTASSLGAAVLYCESCSKETLHRVLRLERPASSRAPKAVAGIARCRECRWTHPFVSVREPRVRLVVVVSKGAASERRTVEVGALVSLRVGEVLPGVEPATRVHRIDRRDGRRVSSAIAREAQTVWGVEEGSRLLRVAVLEGARSTTERLPATPGMRLGVGDSLRLPSGPVTVVGLRAHARTWREPGDVFPVEDVVVVYGRRTVRPPAGSSPWRRDRGTPSSRASSTSAEARSRSSPGVRRNRTVPRARTADGGATERNSSWS
jgi:uncharacterized Zn finger protein